MQNASADKIHELKTDVILIQPWMFAALPGDTPHLWLKTRVANLYGRPGWYTGAITRLLVGVTPIDQISAGSPPKPQRKKQNQKKRSVAQRQLGSNGNRQLGIPST